MEPSSAVSIILLIGTIAFAAYGAWRGAIRQVGSVAAFLLGFMAARIFGPQAAVSLGLPPMLCYAVIFALAFALVIVLARVLRLTVKMLLLGLVDRIVGMLIGAAKWLLLTSLLLNLLLLCYPAVPGLQGEVTRWVILFAPRLFGLANDFLS